MLCLSGLAAPAFAASAEDDAIVAVLAADQARAAALVAADTNALNRLLADDLRYIHANGTVETKAIHVGGFAKGLRYESFKTSNLVGHVITADVVVVTGTIDQRKGAAGKMTDYHLLFQAVWRKKAGAWQLVSLETAIPSAS
jgi:ketosteroid isomerase-like protein